MTRTKALMGMVGSAMLLTVGCAAGPGLVGPVRTGDDDLSGARTSDADAPARPRLAAAIGAPEAGDDAREAPGPDGAEGSAPPTACAADGALKDARLCLPPPAYAKRLCGGAFPEVALGMFGKGTPWTRVWLAGDVDAWNASGGGLTHRAKLAFDEEVLVLAKHGAAPSGGIVMTGAQSSFEVLRSDGTCVSVMEGELTTKRPPAPKPAAVPWTRLEESTRRALLESPKVKASLDTLAKACADVSTALGRKACDKADRAFSATVIAYVRAGAALPVPGRRP